MRHVRILIFHSYHIFNNHKYAHLQLLFPTYFIYMNRIRYFSFNVKQLNSKVLFPGKSAVPDSLKNIIQTL